MSISTKIAVGLSFIFLLFMLMSNFNLYRLRGLLTQHDKVRSLGSEIEQISEKVNNTNIWQDPEKSRTLLKERYEKLLEAQKELEIYGNLLSKTYIAPKNYQNFIDIERQAYPYRVESGKQAKKVYELIDINMRPYFILARNYNEANKIFDKTEKKDFSNLSQMQSEMKRISSNINDAYLMAKNQENISISKDDVEYYQKYNDFFKAWLNYLTYYNDAKNASKRDEAAIMTTALVEWQIAHPLDNLSSKSATLFIKPYADKLNENIRIDEKFINKESKYIENIPFFFGII